MIIHLDMDGVLADFKGYWFKLTGRRCDDYNRGEFWKEAVQYPNIYWELSPMKDSRFLVDNIKDMIKGKDIQIEILTALPSMAEFPLAAKHKEAWVKKHFSGKWKFKTGPFAVDKQKHAKPGDILIDDKSRNIDQWKAAGGTGILHTSAARTIHILKDIIKGEYCIL